MTLKVRDSGGSRFTGVTIIKPAEVGETQPGKEGLPDAIKVMFDAENGEQVCLFVPIGPQAAFVLLPFLKDTAYQAPTTEKELRKFLTDHFPEGEFLVYVQNGSVRSVIAKPGKHLARLHRLFVYRTERGDTRVRIVLRNKEHEEISWTVPWSDAVTLNMDSGDVTIIASRHLFQYLDLLGLDLDRFGQEVEQAEAEGRLVSCYDTAGEPVVGLFEDDSPQSLVRALQDAVLRHGPTWVQVEVVDNPTWGPGPRGVGTKDGVKLVQVIEQEDAVFQRELAVFHELWDALTKLLKGGNARLAVGNSLTAEGREVVKGVAKPILLAYPHLLVRPGTVVWPFSPDNIHLEGLAALDLLAQRLLNHGVEKVNLDDPAWLLNWAKEAVPELAQEKIVEKEAL